MEKETKTINLYDYKYEDGTMIEIPGRLLEGLIQILNEVDKKETTQGFINHYPVAHKEVKDKDFLKEVVVDWEVYPTAESFFSQKPQEIKSMLGVMAVDLLLLLKQAHLENINKGVAKHIGDFEKIQVNEQKEANGEKLSPQ